MNGHTTRGRVVMLVDNGVIHDSRVQKQANSAAERGWDVVLVGKRSNRQDASEWNIGHAAVRLISVPRPMNQRRFEYRRAPLRSPFAYPPGKLAAYRTQQVKAWKTDVRFRRDTIGVGKGKAPALRRGWLAASLFLARVAGKWVAFRAGCTEALRRHRMSMDRPIDKLATAWWRRVLGNRSWRKLDPGIWDWELAYGTVVDKLRPDLIHANDFRMLAVGARAAKRAKAKGRDVKLVWDAHEFLPGIKPWSSHPRWHLAQCALEREFSPCADAVMTVTEQLGDLLVDEHHLAERPTVVLNAPIVSAGDGPASSVVDIRTACDLPAKTPLLVYSGAAAPQRGLDLMVDSLPLLDGVHVALVVASPESRYVTHLVERAQKLGVRNRIHLLPYVRVEDIVPFLSTADIGAIPVHHWPNHEISLGTKFFEYSHARLPILVSDVKAMADMVHLTGQGEVFIAEDLDDYVRAVKALLADKERYVRAYEKPGLLEAWAWEPQANEMDRVYSELFEGQ